MRSDAKERIEHHPVPESVAEALRLAGGNNRFGQPMFRVIWGYDRIVPMTGKWEEWNKYEARLTDKVTKYSQRREFIKLDRSVIETRHVPKYLPANCWHLEMWRPPEEYGSPEEWRNAGAEHIAGMTIDTAGEFPSMGEYELAYPLTDDLTTSGRPVPLVGAVVEEMVKDIRTNRERFNFQQRRAAIEQRFRREEDGFVRMAIDILKDGFRPFAGEDFVTVAEPKRIIEP